MRISLLNHQPELESYETQKTSQLKAMTRILMAMIAMLLIPQVSWAQTEYNVFIGQYKGDSFPRTTPVGTTINSNNASDVKHDSIQGKVSFDIATRTLTLENVTIKGCIYSYGDLTIDLKGSNIIIAPDTSAIVNDFAGTAANNLTIKSSDGTGNLIITSHGNPCVRGFNINYGTGVSLLQGSVDYLSLAAAVGTQMFSGGDGSTNSPYLISSQADLKSLARYVNSGLLTTAGKNFKLTQDINGSKLTSFEPIGYPTKDYPYAPNFEGTFDGGGKKIYNITYNTDVITSTNQNSNGIALFGTCQGAVVKRLTLENCKLGGGYCNGAIAEFFDGTLEDCTISSCTIESNGRNGGLAGYVWTSSVIKNCSVINCTIKDGGAMGGIAGFTEANVSIQNCTVDGGTITTTSGGEFGGIAANGDADISNCIVKGINITCGDGSNAAAIIPYANGGTLVGNYYYADVTVTIGGTTLSGYTQRGTGYVDQNQDYVHNDVPGNDGIVLYTKQLTFSHGGYSNVVADAYYKQSSTNLVSVAPGQPVQLTVTPLGSHLPKDATVTYTPTGGAEQTIKPTKAANSYVYTFTMPDANATFTLDYAIDLGHASLTCLYNNTANYSTDFTALAVVLPTTITMDDGKTVTLLTQGTNYTIEGYKDWQKQALNSTPVNAGTYYVTIKGKGNYTGTTDIQFTINRINLNNVTVTAISDQTYTGSPIEPAITATLNSVVINANEYGVAYTNNKNVSTANAPATVTLSANGYSFTGGSTKTATFKIVAKALTAEMVTLSATTFSYNGSLQKPTVTVKDGNTALTENTDYTLTNAGGTAAGTYNVIVAGKGNYSGSITKQFTISTNTGALTVTPATTSYTYDGTEKKPAVTVKSGTATLTENTDYTVAYTNNINAGTATITVTGKGNYVGATGTATFTITAKALTDAMVTLSATTFSYNGSLQKPTVTVKDGNTALTENTDYTLTNAGGTAAGTYNVIVAGKGNYSGSITKQFTISTNTGALTVTPATTSYTYDGTEKKPAVTVKSGTATLTENTDYTVVYTNNINAGTATITVTGKGNYIGATGTATFTINKAAGSISYAATTINKTFGDAVFTNPLTKTGDGAVTYSSSNTAIATVNSTSGEVTLKGIGSTTITVTVADGTNYTYATKTASYTLNVASKAKKFNLWIDKTQVTEDNMNNILGDAGNSFQYFPDLNKLFITNNTTPVSIETRSGLTIYLGPNSNNKVKQIIRNSETAEYAPLTITTDGNFPGRLELATSGNNVIEGFDDLTLEENLSILEADDEVQYTNGKLATTSATIGIVIDPIVEERVESFEGADFGKNPDGTENDLENYVYDDRVLLTLKNTQSDSGDGIDDSGTQGIVLNNQTYEDDIDRMNLEEYAPGTTAFADIFTGITVLVPGGEGWIVIDGETHDGYCIKLRSLFGDELKEQMTSEIRSKKAFYYTFSEPTFVGIYNGGKTNNAAREKVIRPGKKTVGHIKVFNVNVSPKKVQAANPAGAASGGDYTGVVPTIGQDENNPTEIESGIKDIERSTLNVDHSADKWYNMNGQQIDEPTKAGIYIHNGKKVFVKE